MHWMMYFDVISSLITTGSLNTGDNYKPCSELCPIAIYSVLGGAMFGTPTTVSVESGRNSLVHNSGT